MAACHPPGSLTPVRGLTDGLPARLPACRPPARSGVHRRLGVHVSKVRSTTLDVKVWEPSVMSLFRQLGNGFANQVWEGGAAGAAAGGGGQQRQQPQEQEQVRATAVSASWLHYGPAASL